MYRFTKREAHRFVRRNIEHPLMIAVIRAWEGTRSFVHSLVVFFGYLYLVVQTVGNMIFAGAHYLTISKNWDHILALELERLTWVDLVILAAVPAGIAAVVSTVTAYARWRHWAHHAHKWDSDLSHPNGSDSR